MRSIKPYIWPVLVVALVVAALFTASHRFAAASGGDHNGGGPSKGDPILANASRGVVAFTAAINADGTVANCWGCDPSHTLHLGTGTYQVAFTQDVRATLGFWRWVQVDTLQFDSINNVSCTTADRYDDTKAVWVECFDNSTGNDVDTSFFLFDANSAPE